MPSPAIALPAATGEHPLRMPIGPDLLPSATPTWTLAHEMILVGAALGVLSVLAGLLSRRLGAPVLLVFLVLGMLAGEDGPGRHPVRRLRLRLPGRQRGARGDPVRGRPARRTPRCCAWRSGRRSPWR